MSNEAAFIDSLRALADDPAARGLLDDAAVLEFGPAKLVLTHDMIVEGVHFLAADPPEDVAWKLAAVNLSDLAAKGARPIGVLVGYSLADDEEWNEAFVRGLGEALQTFRTRLLGGDTVSGAPGAPRAYGLTAIGEATGPVPSRAGAQAGDRLWVSGTIGDAGAGLRVSVGEIAGPAPLVARYRRPEPRLELGAALAPLVSAMMDVSDGLLIDASRMAAASRVCARVELLDLPLSEDLLSALGESRQTRIDAAVAGDDYELLFAAPADKTDEVRRIADDTGVRLTALGCLRAGDGICLTEQGIQLPLPQRLGYEHRATAC